MEHIEDDALSEDALQRLGVEEYENPEPQAEWTAALGAVLPDTELHPAQFRPATVPITTVSYPALDVEGQATINGDLHVTGNIVFDTNTSRVLTFDGNNWINTQAQVQIQDDLQLALDRIEQLEHEIVMLRGEMLLLSQQGENNE
jgi:hypothetical protein